MQQHIYTAQRSKIIGQTFIIWLFILIQVIMTVFAITRPPSHDKYLLVFIVNAFMLCLNGPSLYIFITYYKYSRNKQFIVAYSYLQMKDILTHEVIEMKSEDIVTVELVTATYSKLPSFFHEYFCFTDIHNNKIIVTSYIMGIHQFWLDRLSRRVSSDKLIWRETYFPSLPKYITKTNGHP